MKAKRGDPHDPRVWERVIARGVANRSLNRGRFERIPRYLAGDSYPRENEALLIGQTLHEHVPWCSGLLLLWLCGHYDVAVHAVALWLRDAQQRSDWPQLRSRISDLFLPAFENTRRIFAESPLDSDHDLLRMHLTTAEMDTTTMALLVQRNPALASNHEPQLNSDEARFILREHAKATWSALDPFMPDIEAHALTLAPERGEYNTGIPRPPIPEFLEQNQHDEIVRAMIDVSKSTKISIRSQEIALRTMLTRWINDLESSLWSRWRME